MYVPHEWSKRCREGEDVFATFFDEMRSKNKAFIIVGDLNWHGKCERHTQKMQEARNDHVKNPVACKSGPSARDEAMRAGIRDEKVKIAAPRGIYWLQERLGAATDGIASTTS